MACFIVPATEAIVTTVATKLIERKENKGQVDGINLHLVSTKLKRLNKLLAGGSALLAFEHFYHGEIQPFFPFLTAMESADATAEMLHEMSTVGVGMAFAVTAIWGVATLVEYLLSSPRDNAELSNLSENEGISISKKVM